MQVCARLQLWRQAHLLHGGQGCKDVRVGLLAVGRLAVPSAAAARVSAHCTAVSLQWSQHLCGAVLMHAEAHWRGRRLCFCGRPCALQELRPAAQVLSWHWAELAPHQHFWESQTETRVQCLWEHLSPRLQVPCSMAKEQHSALALQMSHTCCCDKVPSMHEWKDDSGWTMRLIDLTRSWM